MTNLLTASLNGTPFRNILKFDMSEVVSYLEPHLRTIAELSYSRTGMPISPGVFLFSSSDVFHISCYEYPTPKAFLSFLRNFISEKKIVRSVTFSAVGAVLDSPSKYMLVDVQTKKERVRAAVGLGDDTSVYEVDDAWGVKVPLPVDRDVPPGLETEPGYVDPVSQMVLESDVFSCTLGGAEMFAPLFSADQGTS